MRAHGLLAFFHIPALLLAAIIIFSFGSGLLEPSLRGLLSRAASDEQQGFVQGSAQSMQSIASIVGPLCAGILYAQAGHAWPYGIGASIAVLAVIIVVFALPSLSRAHGS